MRLDSTGTFQLGRCQGARAAMKHVRNTCKHNRNTQEQLKERKHTYKKVARSEADELKTLATSLS